MINPPSPHRCAKRLATLAGVQPPYMDEYEALTGQLQVVVEDTCRGTRNKGGVHLSRTDRQTDTFGP